MPLETFSGSAIPALLLQAQAKLGHDAVVLGLRRVGEGARSGFELVAADAESAGAWMHPLPGRRAPVTGMKPALPAKGKSARPYVVALVGPTGAGKTTTIAKLANHRDVFGRCDAGLICLDTYRVGAVEQSKAYAKLSRVPLEIVYEPRDAVKALRALRACDVVLVDTAGRGPRRASDARATQTLLRSLAPREVHLTLPAGLRREAARRIVQEHLPYGVTHLIATKLDEFPGDEAAASLAAEFGLPMRWVADGQEVPGDLKSARETCESSAADERDGAATMGAR